MAKITKKVIPASRGNKPKAPIALPTDFDSWVGTPPTSKPGKACVTCAYGQAVIDCVKKFMQARIDGKTRKRNTELKEWMAVNLSYTYAVGTLNRHIRECEPELYEQMRRADIAFKMVLGPCKLDKGMGRTGENNEQK